MNRTNPLSIISVPKVILEQGSEQIKAYAKAQTGIIGKLYHPDNSTYQNDQIFATLSSAIDEIKRADNSKLETWAKEANWQSDKESIDIAEKLCKFYLDHELNERIKEIEKEYKKYIKQTDSNKWELQNEIKNLQEINSQLLKKIQSTHNLLTSQKADNIFLKELMLEQNSEIKKNFPNSNLETLEGKVNYPIEKIIDCYIVTSTPRKDILLGKDPQYYSYQFNNNGIVPSWTEFFRLNGSINASDWELISSFKLPNNWEISAKEYKKISPFIQEYIKLGSRAVFERLFCANDTENRFAISEPIIKISKEL